MKKIILLYVLGHVIFSCAMESKSSLFSNDRTEKDRLEWRQSYIEQKIYNGDVSALKNYFNMLKKNVPTPKRKEIINNFDVTAFDVALENRKKNVEYLQCIQCLSCITGLLGTCWFFSTDIDIPDIARFYGMLTSYGTGCYCALRIQNTIRATENVTSDLKRIIRKLKNSQSENFSTNTES